MSKPTARVFSFDLQFGGGKKTRFYRMFFGYTSRTTKESPDGEKKVYERTYPGILTSIPHLRLGRSVIAVPKEASDKVDSFFQDPKWNPRRLFVFDAVLPSEDRYRAMNDALDRIRMSSGRSLHGEIDALLSNSKRGRFEREDRRRAKTALDMIKRLLRYDWSEKKEFSKALNEKLSPLMEALKQSPRKATESR